MTSMAAKRYATGLFDFAEETGQTDNLAQEFKDLLRDFSKNPELKSFLSSPLLEAKRKGEIAELIFKDFSAAFRKFVQILIRHKREPVLVDAGRYFQKLVNQKNKIKKVTLTTASPLSKTEEENIIGKVKSLHGGDFTYDIESKIKPEILGGFVLKIDDLLVDASIKNQLQRLKREFSYNDYQAKF